MITLKKQELEDALLNISSIDPKTNIIKSGLLIEKITLSCKRKLQKIHKQALSYYKELIEEIKQVKEECGDDKEKLSKELIELGQETVILDVEPIKWSDIENVSSSTNYNFEILEKIAI